MDIVTYALLNGKIKNYASNVDEWLEENVDPDTGYVLDRSLQMENAAAPADMVGDIRDTVSDVKNTLSHKADAIYDTASGPIASFPDGADGLPVKDLTVGIEPVQSGTGDPSPTNVRPISGWTGCNISHSGADTSDPTVISISWQSEAGAVYGGTLDVTSGVLTVDKARKTFTNSDTWVLGGATSGIKRFLHTFSPSAKEPETPSIQYTDGLYCNLLKLGADGTPAPFCRVLIGSRFDVFLPESMGVTTIDGMKSWAVTNGLEVVYPLATPIVIQLDPVTVTTLLGQNNIWADTGDSTVEYPCDTKLYIERLTAPEEDDMIADTNIASGKYFIINNNLYLSATAILAGDPIKPGTNCTLTNLAAALNALNS